MTCRHCAARLGLILADLGTSPPSNAYLTADRLPLPETHFPLRVLVCERCWLIQTEDVVRPDDLFDQQYAYFSGVSRTWTRHVEAYVTQMVERLSLDRASHVVEVAANDGTLLQFVHARGIRCTGVEPTAGTAAAARSKGLRIIEDFFGRRLGQEMAATDRADLIVANNVLAHVPDINDFVAGVTELLERDGVATFEFPHALHLVTENLFDTIYHEHYSYLSMTAVERIFVENGLSVFDVSELPTHGGSLRVFAQRSDSGSRQREARLDQLLEREQRAGLTTPEFYAGFQARAERARNDFLRFLLDAADDAKCVAAYGAAAKGNTLINFAGVRSDLIPFVVDASPAKQGKFLPGSRIPIVAEERLRADTPDYVLILPWNLRAEVTEQIGYIADWGGRFVTAIPTLHVGP